MLTEQSLAIQVGQYLSYKMFLEKFPFKTALLMNSKADLNFIKYCKI